MFNNISYIVYYFNCIQFGPLLKIVYTLMINKYIIGFNFLYNINNQFISWTRYISCNT